MWEINGPPFVTFTFLENGSYALIIVNKLNFQTSDWQSFWKVVLEHIDVLDIKPFDKSAITEHIQQLLLFINSDQPTWQFDLPSWTACRPALTLFDTDFIPRNVRLSLPMHSSSLSPWSSQEMCSTFHNAYSKNQLISFPWRWRQTDFVPTIFLFIAHIPRCLLSSFFTSSASTCSNVVFNKRQSSLMSYRAVLLVVQRRSFSRPKCFLWSRTFSEPSSPFGVHWAIY